MQDKTINNALLTLAKLGGSQGKLADVLLEMRGVEWSGIVQHAPFKRGGAKAIVIEALREGPATPSELAGTLMNENPVLDYIAARNRAYQALHRLKSMGLVAKDGRAWRLVPR